MVWAFETLARLAAPDVIVHDCTPRFDTGALELIFGGMFVVMSLVFSPTDLGWPANRPRRWTLMIHWRRVVAMEPQIEISLGPSPSRASSEHSFLSHGPHVHQFPPLPVYI